jgi:hypothetical protein
MYRITVSSGSSFDLKQQPTSGNSNPMLLDKIVEKMDYDVFQSKLSEAINAAMQAERDRPKVA